MAYNPYSLGDKTILVTGASSGIGQATAIECSKMGAKVVITARNKERLEQTMSMLEGEGHRMIISDLADIESLNQMVEQIPMINGFSYNTGIACIKPVVFYKERDIQTVMQTNAVAAAMLTKACIKSKKLAKGASLVFTSSIEGTFGTGTGNGVYGMSKAALSAFVKTAALELSAKGVRCNTINPGMVKTPLITSGEISEEQLQLDAQKYPLGRYGEPKEIALATIYLLSDAAAWITGTELKIDGGITLL
jgi:NAD(P)-dependent dehydrogenase (short-subunit alcohol dehydrogenase family)